MRRVLFALLLILLPALGHAEVPLNLTAQEQTWLRERLAPLRVHNELDWLPYNFNQAGKPQGYSIDYMNLLAKKLGLKIEYVSGPTWDEFLDMMKNRSLDIMLNIANTKDRREYLAFTEPYYITNVGLYVRNRENGIADLGDMAGKRLAFPKGFFFEEFIRKYYPEIKIVTFDSAPASFKGVAEGRADAAMDTPGVARRILQEEKLTGLKFGGKVSDPRFITTFSIATRSDNHILRNILQKGMDSISPAEEQELSRKWSLKEASETAAPLPAGDMTYLQQIGRLRYCAHPDLLPLEAITLDGAHTGVSSEFVKMMSERMDVPMQLIQTRSWEESLGFIGERRCDLVPMASRPATSDSSLKFTSPWLSPELVIATRHDQIYISDIKQVLGNKVGVVRDSAAMSILRASFPNLELVEMDSVSAGLKDVDKGRLFGFVDILPLISRTMQSEAVKSVKISGGIGLSAPYAIGVHPSDAKLAEILDHAVTSIDREAVQTVYKRWLAVAYVDRVDYSYLWQLLAGVFVVGLFVLYHFRKGMRVTAELRAAHSQVEAANRSLDEKNQALDRLARTDSLTGLFNRHMINETLGEEVKRYQRYGTVFSVILLDIDHFKAVNDTHGHQTGDVVLRKAADLLRRHTRESDLVGRWGGEEFLIICPSTTLEGAMRLAEILRAELPRLAVGDEPKQTASFGVAASLPGETTDQLIGRADRALYQAKEAGRNRVVCL
ncbi:putative Sensory transduction histidine kinase [Rhodospirillaceae bacterium LM-1]|nr:putative Sensory transduction histidine kinase [Rhodospirillaceae bacterium LM-1]